MLTWIIEHPALFLVCAIALCISVMVLIRILRAIIIGAAIWILVHWFFHDWR